MRVQMLNVVRGEDGIHRTRRNSRHIGHRADHIRLNGRIDVQTDFGPLWGIETLGGFVFALGAAADVEERFHGASK